MIYSVLIKKKIIYVFVVLIFCSICIMDAGLMAYTTTKQKIEEISDSYTTLAVPCEELDPAKYEDYSRYFLSQEIDNYVKINDAVLSVNYNYLLSAHTPELKGMSSGSLEWSNYHEAYDRACYSMSVIAVKCIDIEKNISNSKKYEATFEILDFVSVMDAYNLPPFNDIIKIRYGNNILEKEKIPFEVGKTYLLRGQYIDYEVEKVASITGKDGLEQIENAYLRNYTWKEEPGARYRYFDLGLGVSIGEGYPVENNYVFFEGKYGEPQKLHKDFITYLKKEENTGEYYSFLKSDCSPMWVEYTGNWQDFIESEKGRIWKDEIIPTCKLNNNSVQVFLTNDIMSIYSFNIGGTNLSDGRYFSKEEYYTGEKVCLISAEYAEYNNLKIGDVVLLDFYDSGYEMRTNSRLAFPTLDTFYYVCRFPMTEETKMEIKNYYKVVGIYNGKNFPNDIYSFGSNTIIVPKKSIVNSDVLLDTFCPLLYSITLKNGEIENFEKDLTKAGFGNYFKYCDQGFENVVNSFYEEKENSRNYFCLSIMAFLLISIIAVIIYLLELKKTCVLLWRIGVGNKQIYLTVLWIGLLAIIFIAVSAHVFICLGNYIMSKSFILLVVQNYGIILNFIFYQIIMLTSIYTLGTFLLCLENRRFR